MWYAYSHTKNGTFSLGRDESGGYMVPIPCSNPFRFWTIQCVAEAAKSAGFIPSPIDREEKHFTLTAIHVTRAK